MKQSEQKNRRRLTGLYVDPKLGISERRQDEPAGESESLSGFEKNDFRIQSRDVHVLLQLRRNAGVSSGLTTEGNSGSRQPTRQEARWVFAFSGDP
jgi:hypothetical protein